MTVLLVIRTSTRMPSWEQTTLSVTPPNLPRRSDSTPKINRPKELISPMVPRIAAASWLIGAQVSQVGHLMHRNGEDTGGDQELTLRQGPRIRACARLWTVQGVHG